MTLTPDCKKMLNYIKENPGIFISDLSNVCDDYEKILNFLIKSDYVEHIIKDGKKMNFFRLSVSGEVYLETEKQKHKDQIFEITIKILNIITPLVSVLLGFWLGRL